MNFLVVRALMGPKVAALSQHQGSGLCVLFNTAVFTWPSVFYSEETFPGLFGDQMRGLAYTKGRALNRLTGALDPTRAGTSFICAGLEPPYSKSRLG